MKENKLRKTPPYFARVLLVILGLATLYTTYDLNASSNIYSTLSKDLDSQKNLVETVDIDNTRFSIPTYELFGDGRIWSYVNKSNSIANAYKPNITAIPVEHGDSNLPMSISTTISKPLMDLVKSAKNEGISLMVASAYRSKDEQKLLYDKYMTTRGRAFTVSHVAEPGTSEHQTGLAVDFSTASTQCSQDSDKCELNSLTIAWLAQNAYKYGFIQRYPMGKQSITGMANEEWHYRYVGVPLARALTKSGLTFDEFVSNTAPGYAK